MKAESVKEFSRSPHTEENAVEKDLQSVGKTPGTTVSCVSMIVVTRFLLAGKGDYQIKKKTSHLRSEAKPLGQQ